MNAKISVFVISVEATIYLLLYNLHDCTFNEYQLLRDSDIPDHAIELCKTDRGDLKLDSLWSFTGK